MPADDVEAFFAGATVNKLAVNVVGALRTQGAACAPCCGTDHSALCAIFDGIVQIATAKHQTTDSPRDPGYGSTCLGARSHCVVVIVGIQAV